MNEVGCLLRKLVDSISQGQYHWMKGLIEKEWTVSDSGAG